MFFDCKKGSKRGQFTLFIIVGLVIMFVFGFAFYARVQIIQASLSQQADTQLKDYLNKNSINQYVTSCLDAVVDEVFLNASMSGGRLLLNDEDSEIPSIIYKDFKLGRDYEVAVTVRPNLYTECLNPISKTPDRYIVTDEPGLYPYNCRYETLEIISRSYKRFGTDKCYNDCTYNNFWSYSGFFGVNKLQPLCNGYGANAPGIVSNQNFRTCDYYDYKGDSLQELIEEKISEEIKHCINFSEIISRSPSNITVDEDNVKATVIFGREEFDVRLEYPFTVTVRNKEPVTKMVNFSINRQLPFKELYEYAYELSNSDVTNIFFDMFDDKDKVKSKSARRFNTNIYNSNFMINIIRGDSSNGYTDLVQIIDTEHNILGVPLTINFGVKNRRPALDYIHIGTSEVFDLGVTEDSTIQINPAGYDPDGEKSLIYTYSGWREDYIEKYNYDDEKCTNPELMTLEYVLEKCSIKVELDSTVDISDIPHDWTKSELFKQTAKNASYYVTRDDVGFHTVTVSVRDREGLYDFQTIKILVMDLPTAMIDGSNIYDDVDDGFASYEDPYILDGSSSSVGTIASLMGIKLSMFEWKDKMEIPEIEYERILMDETTKKQLDIPFDLIAPASTDIINIVNTPFRKSAGVVPPREGIIHDIEFTVTTDIGLQDTEILPVKVMQCLPHRNTAIPTPYPYDSLIYGVPEGDLNAHLMSDHTCCTNDMTYEETSKACFTDVNYGLYDKFKDYATLSVMPPAANQYSKTPKPNTYNSQNDIFKQEFKRFCSGDRGNICSGNGEDIRTIYTQCDDTNLGTISSSSLGERCSGPPIGMLQGNVYETEEEAECQNYYKTTFEKLSNSAGATGYCDNQKKFASGPGFAYGKFNDPIKQDNYLCLAQCDGNGGCTYPAECTCKQSAQGNGNALCDGLSYSTQLQTPTKLTCNFDGDQDYFKFFCNSQCQLIEDPQRLCRWSNDDSTGCEAAQYCDGISINGVASKDSIDKTKKACVISNTRWTYCDNTCQYHTNNPASYANICRAAQSGDGCTANDKCDGLYPGNQISNDDNDMTSESGQYCNNNCQIINCGKYAIDTSTLSNGNVGRCFNSCSSDSQCAEEHVCCTDSTAGACGLGNSYGTCYLNG